MINSLMIYSTITKLSPNHWGLWNVQWLGPSAPGPMIFITGWPDWFWSANFYMTYWLKYHQWSSTIYIIHIQLGSSCYSCSLISSLNHHSFPLSSMNSPWIADFYCHEIFIAPLNPSIVDILHKTYPNKIS